MNKIIVKNQEEFDKLPNEFRNYTEIQIRGHLDRINRTFINAKINLYDSAQVEYMSDSAQVEYMSDSAQVGNMYGSTQIRNMYGSTQIRNMYGSAQVGNMYGSTQIRNMYGSAQIEDMYGSARVINMYDSAQVGYMSDSAQVGSMSDSARVEHMYNTSQVRRMYDLAQVRHIFGSAQIKSMFGLTQIKYMSMNSTAKILSTDVIIHEARQNVILIYQDCTGSPRIKDDSVIINYTKSAESILNNFIKGYDVKTENNKLVLYKFVRKNYTDFFTGTIEYKIGTIVKCPDWNSNADIECGGGLHVSPSIEFCKRFNNSKDGHALKVLVDPKDIIVHPNPIYPYKIRCRQLEVLEEIEG